MSICFDQQIRRSVEDDAIILFSTSDSNEESASSSSSHRHSSPPLLPPPPPAHTRNTLSVGNLSYTIHPNKPKQINVLKSISFHALSSELLAVVGPSGTGKSTLLRAISGRIRSRDLDPNTVSINGTTINNPKQLRAICGYVDQEDNLLPMLTVKETLMFSAKFRLIEMSSYDREARVEALIQELGLSHVRDSFVGNEEKRGISGGERKRVSIGIEIIHDPPILLLDEPTSGLDSSSALQVIELLSSMARSKQKIIVLSIHQPSYRILRFISKFMIISRGSVAHYGSIELLEKRVAEMGHQIPLQLNALEFAMEILPKLEETYRKDNNLPLTKTSSLREIHGVNDHHNALKETIILCSRFWKVIYRTKQLLLARAMQALVGGFGLGSVYINMTDDQEGVAERLGFFAFSLSFLLSSTVEALPIFLQERKVVMKEVSQGSYKVSSYLIANTLVFLPFLLVVALLFSIPVYWIVGLSPSITAFAFFVLVVWLIVLMASSLVLFLSAISQDFVSGNSLICTVLGSFFLFSGYFIPKDSIPDYWVFMYYVSLYRYALDSLLVNEYQSLGDKCFSWENGDRSQCLMTGRDVLTGRGLEKDTRWANVGIMVAFFVFYRVICWVVLARRASKTTS